ncbi:hypothetical protein QUA20_23810 [Microcoleus sp. Pol7_A1]|uniref:hypothetical protein n=1 Tax=Microcoleus sp. Pol7_A1 TaxID=2818893 RepID=UPI002FCFE7B7
MIGIVLLLLQRIYLNPRDFEAGALEIKKGLPGLFWVSLDTLGLIGAGYGIFPSLPLTRRKNGYNPPTPVVENSRF